MSAETETQSDRFATEKWREHIDETVHRMQTTINTLSANLASALAIHASNASQISDNTRITLDLKESLDRFQLRAMPAIEVTETMQRGALALGNILEFMTKWGGRLWRVSVFTGATWIAFKLLTSGGSWGDAVKAFFSFQQH